MTEAKNRLSALLERVRHGETILIEDRGIPVAQIAPVAGRAAVPDRDRLARLERHGVVRPAAAAAPRKRLLAAPPRGRGGRALSRLVLDERSEGW